MARTVALTGATGFVGSHLVKDLAQAGWNVRALTRRPVPGDTPSNVAWISGSLEDDDSLRALLEGADAVVHCAGAIKALHARAFFQANAEGTERLAEIAAAMETPPRFLYMSSVAARRPEISDYAASKRAGEDILSRYSDRLSWWSLRPGAVYGPGDTETLRMFKMASAGIAALPGAGTGRVSLVHVTDLTAAVIALLDSPVESGAILEVDDATAGGYTLRALYEAIAEEIGRRPVYLKVPRNVLAGVAFCNSAVARITGRPAMIAPGKVREIYHDDWATDSSRLRELTGWRPAIDAKVGLKSAITWYKSQGLL